MFQLQDRLEVAVERLSYGGNGIAKPGGFTLFVPRTAPGDRVLVEVESVRKRFGKARIVEIIEPSTLREVPTCKYYGTCGSCHYQHIDPSYIANEKVRQIKETLVRIGPGDFAVSALVVPQDSWNYRNRMTFHCSPDGTMGYVRWDRQGLVDVAHCPIGSKNINETWTSLREHFSTSPLEQLRYVVLRETQMGVSIILSLATPVGQHDTSSLRTRFEFLPKNNSLFCTSIEEGSYTPFGENIVHLLGASEIVENVEGINYEVRPDLFFQVNPEMTKHLIRHARQWAKETKANTCLDLYCGAGLFSLALAKTGIPVTGVEINHIAIDYAKRSALRNQLESHATFRAGKVETIVKKFARDRKRFPHLVVDPPRKGLGKEFFDHLNVLGVEHLLYISCSPPTMARDLKILTQYGFTIDSVTPYDMFPHTYHVETITSLHRPISVPKSG